MRRIRRWSGKGRITTETFRSEPLEEGRYEEGLRAMLIGPEQVGAAYFDGSPAPTFSALDAPALEVCRHWARFAIDTALFPASGFDPRLGQYPTLRTGLIVALYAEEEVSKVQPDDSYADISCFFRSQKSSPGHSRCANLPVPRPFLSLKVRKI
jgi:hypothetical protein